MFCKRFDKAYIGETGRKLADHFCEHFMDIDNGAAIQSLSISRVLTN